MMKPDFPEPRAQPDRVTAANAEMLAAITSIQASAASLRALILQIRDYEEEPSTPP